MSENIYNLKINLTQYPMCNICKKKELDFLLQQIFQTGYDIMYPKHSSTDPLVGKITSLENTLDKLIGIGSSKKGELAEIILASHITSRYGDIVYIDTAHTPHSGDAHIKFDGSDTTIMLESKNYINKVAKDEIDKMKFDMIHSNITWGIFISWNSSIINMKEFDIDFFHEKGKTYHIIYIANLSSDIDRLDLALQLIRKLISYTMNNNITWIHNMIQNDLMQLNNIISKNYQLRIQFEEMEINVNQQMNKYYSKLRDYMFELDQQVKQIITNITNTTIQSINIDHDIYNMYLEKYKDSKKIFPILAQLLDIMKQYNITINEDDMIYSEIIVGNIKVMSKKITIYWNKYKHTSTLDYENNVESFDMIRLFASSINK